MGFGQLFAKGLILNCYLHVRFQCTYLQYELGREPLSPTAKVKECLLKDIQSRISATNKVTVVGAGTLGIASAYTIMAQNLSHNLCLIDRDKTESDGELMDLLHGSCFWENLHVDATADYAASAGSKVCIVTTDIQQEEGESRLNLAQRNIEVVKEIIPPLAAHSPDAVILIATNPVDIMTYVAWKLSGFPRGRVIGTGTNLDSSRFRRFLAERLGISPDSCHGWIIGEHGDSSVPVWSGVNVAGVNFTELNPFVGTCKDTECWDEIHKKVISTAYDVIKLKGYTCWGAAMSIASLTQAILNNFSTVNAVSLQVKGYYGIKEDVCLSLPAVLGIRGVTDVIIQPLSETEIMNLHYSAQRVARVQRETKF